MGATPPPHPSAFSINRVGSDGDDSDDDVGNDAGAFSFNQGRPSAVVGALASAAGTGRSSGGRDGATAAGLSQQRDARRDIV